VRQLWAPVGTSFILSSSGQNSRGARDDQANRDHARRGPDPEPVGQAGGGDPRQGCRGRSLPLDAGGGELRLGPPLQYVGAEAHNPKGLTDWFNTWKGPIGYDLHDFSVTAGEDLAHSYGLVHMSGTRTDGKETDVWVRQTLCLRKVEGAWTIAHEHTSVPFYIDGSNKAALDLKP
jgi:ketosteroid isomerase-like protein